MRLALVLDRFTPARGGLESWAARFAAWLLDRGHEVHAVAFEFEDVAVPRDIVRHGLPRPPGRLDRARALEACLRGLPGLLVHDFGVGWRYDLLHVHAGSRRTARRQALRALPLTARLRALLACARAGRDGRLEARQYAPGPGRIVTVSRMVKAQLVRDYRVDPARIDVAWNGVDPVAYSPACRERERAPARRRLELGDATTFLFLAHNYRLKGLWPAVHALARLVREGHAVRLCVVGNGPGEAFAHEAARLGVARHVRVERGVPDPRSHLAAADVLLHPTFYDACSLVVLEAWAMGVPAITTRWNGVHDLWPDDGDGWVVGDASDGRAVADAMRRALDPARRAAAGAVARSVAVAHSLEANFARIAALYATLAPGGGGPPP